ncbi:MAG: endonuclease [Paludibacteraceae bacterium]|nr:endonuclease [Paludibacteraceae bacterium]
MKKFFVIKILLLFFLISFAQSQGKQNFKVVFYNTENFFDCFDDSLTNDAEFLPNGTRGWTFAKYKKKQNNIGKVITAIGGWDAPALVGLAEVENERCLIDLTRYSGLKNLHYKFLHFESPDPRGIDVVLLYQPQFFKPLISKPIPIHFSTSPQTKTRDILYAAGTIPTGDTLHVFVCHFPSRLGGELESENKRREVAAILRTEVDSIYLAHPHPYIVIMGDFNDYPTNKSLLKTLRALPPSDSIYSENLYNLMYPLHIKGKGSHKYNGEWGALDQFIVSGALLKAGEKFYTLPMDAHFFEADFLLEDDKTNLGKQPFRTYLGMKYQGGFSDHLPICLNFWY